MRLRPKFLSIWHSAAIVFVLIVTTGRSGAEQQETSKRDHDEVQLAAANRSKSKQAPQLAVSEDDGKSQQQTRKCARQSIMLARQMLVHELEHINNFNSMWFSDLNRDELIEGQKHSLSNIVMSGFGTRLLHPDGQPLIEIESSYFRNHAAHSTNHNQHSNWTNGNNKQQGQPLSIKLVRRHHDRCSLSSDGSQFAYTFGLSVGPIEHHLDVVYNLPKDLSLGQPLDWRYGQIIIRVPRMIYEVTLKQMVHYKLNSWTPYDSGCPLDLADLLYLTPNSYNTSSASGQQQQQQQQSSSNKPQLTITSSGLALSNQTINQMERLFDDYTRPTISRRLRQMLRFYLNAKTLPLSSVCLDDHC